MPSICSLISMGDLDRYVDSHDLAEGLYIKCEDPATGTVIGRYKWVRASFLTAVTDSGSHWHSRPIVANQLAEGVDLFDQTG